VLGWDVTARDASYPAARSQTVLVADAVAGGRLPFDRKNALGLHHLVLE
jgi:hypothetical protein